MKIVFSDFDGTLTINGKLGAVFFKIIELIEKSQSELVIVSGRSISWGHFLLTHFPLKYVIMEGGGVIVSKSKEGVISEENMVNDETMALLEATTTEIKQKFPEVIFSADTLGRKTDRAVEFGLMNPTDVEKLEKYLDQKETLNYSRSNVHINFWAGEISKAKGVGHFLKNHAPHLSLEECIFYGDAANDESMFELFPNTVGVSNILSVLDQLEYKPRIVLEGKDNAGAHGVYNHLLELFSQSEDF